jgi:thiamine biosynthesis lipoprotein
VLVLACISCAPRSEVHERTELVMATIGQLKVVSADASAASDALQGAFDELRRIEALTSSYSDSSEVAQPARGLGEDTRAILATAEEVEAASGGAFSPRLGALLKVWGFPDATGIPDSAAVAEAAAAAREPDALMDLGGVAKGYGVDQAADRLGEVGGCLVNVGGDLAVRGARADGRGWLIGVQDPRDPSKLFLRLRVQGSMAVATSGDYQRYVEADGVRYHHILDPATGWPSRELRSVTVIAPTCALADAWATAAFVLGPEAGLRALEENPRLEGVLVAEDGRGKLVLHETSGFAAWVEGRS